LNGISGQKPSHHGGDRRKTRTQQKVGMIGYQRPCKTIGMRLGQHLAQSLYKGLAVGIIPKNFPALDSTHDGVSAF
jgi:hypothetical protein